MFQQQIITTGRFVATDRPEGRDDEDDKDWLNVETHSKKTEPEF